MSLTRADASMTLRKSDFPSYEFLEFTIDAAVEAFFAEGVQHILDNLRWFPKSKSLWLLSLSQLSSRTLPNSRGF